MNERARTLAVGLALAFCLVAGSTPRVVGDGGEYLAQAMNFAALSGPPLGRRAIQQIEPRIKAIAPELAEWNIEAATVPSADRRRDFLHFWCYALTVTPALWVVDALGLSPIWAFTLTNLLFVALAAWVLLPRIGSAATLLVLGGPLVWWFDKPHTEVFTVALLAIALALWRDRPVVAYIAAGLAATQNVPVSAVVGCLIGIDVWRRRGRGLLDPGWLAGAGAGIGLALLHPIYTYVRHGMVTLLLHATRPGLPTFAELSAILADPTIGLAGNAPFLLMATAIAVAAAAWRGRLHLLSGAAPVAVVSAAVFLVAAAQTSNTHHGATPSLSRYALWLLPLTVPFFAAVWQSGSATIRRVIVLLSLLSTATSIVAFHPGVPQYGREPTWLAEWLWTAHPTRTNPLPEVFSETLLRVEGTTVPAATDRCEKLLIAPGDAADGTWPVPCYPAELPASCAGREQVCYANATRAGYQFVRAPGRQETPFHDRAAAWPAEAEPHVRAIFDRWRWWDLAARSADVRAIRGGEHVQTAVFGSDDRFLVIARPRGPGAVIHLRPLGTRLAGRLYDATNGAVARTLSFEGTPGDLWSIDLPADHPFLVAGLTIAEVPE